MKRQVIAAAVAAAAAAVPSTSDAYVAGSTSYCLTGRMADGTYTRWGSAASNRHRLGTVIRLTRSFYGRTTFTIRDRIGSGSQLDLWAPSCAMSRSWGRRIVSYSVVG